MDMGQQTPPSPMGLFHELDAETYRTDTANFNLANSQIHMSRRHNLSPYWQKQPDYDGSGDEMDDVPYVQHPYFPRHGQNNALRPFLSDDDSIVSGSKTDPPDEKVSKQNIQHTSGISPPVNPGATKLGGVESKLLQSSSSTSIIPKSHTARKRRTTKNRTKQIQTDTLGTASKPLSKIAAESPHVYVPNAEIFAHRSVEDRRREAAVGGKIKRPLNAFMLYRRSYQNAAKTRCMRNNHQQISMICGDSWKSCESPDVVEKFNRLAYIEKEMHKQAFPDYKYDPVVSKKMGDGVELPISSERGNIDDRTRPRLLEHGHRRRGSHSSPGPQSGQDEAPWVSRQGTGLDSGLPSSNNIDFSSTLPLSRCFATPPEPNTFLQTEDLSCRDQHNGTSTEDPWILGGTALPTAVDDERGIITDPNLYFFGPSYIDTALLTVPCNSHFDTNSPRLPISMNTEEGCDQQAAIKPDPEEVVFDLDRREACNAYLKGANEDWEVERLTEESHFQDWFSQIASNNRDNGFEVEV